MRCNSQVVKHLETSFLASLPRNFGNERGMWCILKFYYERVWESFVLFKNIHFCDLILIVNQKALSKSSCMNSYRCSITKERLSSGKSEKTGKKSWKAHLSKKCHLLKWVQMRFWNNFNLEKIRICLSVNIHLEERGGE